MCPPAEPGERGRAPDTRRPRRAWRTPSSLGRVEPGERTRAELEAALSRHHKRVHLTEEQWGEMVDYLAAPADAGVAEASPPDAGRQ